MNSILRPFRKSDAAATAQVFYDAVHIGTKADYTQEERAAWAPEKPKGLVWLDRLQSQITIVAVEMNEVVGFMTLSTTGHVDLAFVAPSATGRGIGRLLYEAIVIEACRMELECLTVDASKTARPFFEKLGWKVVRQQMVERTRFHLQNFAMTLDV